MKMLHGSSFTNTGTVEGVLYEDIRSPWEIGSPSHPDPRLYYNDDFDELTFTWQRPFPAVNGYYEALNTLKHFAPDSGSGTWSPDEQTTHPRASVTEGQNYIHVAAVDSQSNTSGMEGRFLVNINATPPSVSSSSHPSQYVWYSEPTVNLGWSDNRADQSFAGYYFTVDQYGDTVPSEADTFTPVDQKSTVLSNQPDGVFAFHIVPIDTMGYLTKQARTYVFRIGEAPGEGNVIGNVEDEDGNEIAGALVTINRGLFPELDDQNTDSDGFFNFGGAVPAGDWELRVTAEGYETQDVAISLTAGQSLIVDVSLVPQ